MARTRDLFDALAEDYESMRREVGWDPFPHMRWFLETWPMAPQGKVLDIGGGTGEIARWLEGQGFAVTLMDVSPQMCLRARAQFSGKVLCRDMNKGLPFADGSFDRVVALGCTEYAQDLKSLLDEMRRVLNPQGALLTVIELCGPEHVGGEEERVPFLDDWSRRRWPLATLESYALEHFSKHHIDLVPGFWLEDDATFSEYGRLAGQL